MADVTREEVSLATLGSGAAVERFDAALKEALANIADPNTAPKITREITLKVKIKPNEERSYGVIEIHTAAKLGPIKHYETGAFMGTDGKRSVAYENDPQQHKLPGSEEGEDNVRDFKGGQRG